jgi:dTDP-4-dehydrorhamnose 3,5-epimerase
MKLISTPFEGLWVLQPALFEDNRGFFYESYNQIEFNEKLPPVTFLQDNHSRSGLNVLRGLHLQHPPFGQTKLVRVVKGAVMDVVVDVRKHSKTYGSYFKIELNESNKIMLWIPEGFAHGFLTLQDRTEFLYKCSNVYHKAAECCIRWNDPDLSIDWGIKAPLVSEKDLQGIAFKDLSSLF